MCEIENIFDDGLEISVKQEGIVNFTVRERQTKKDIIIPFEEKKGRFYITFYDLSRVLYSDNTKAFFDFYLWIDGKRFSKIKNFRKRPREIS